MRDLWMNVPERRAIVSIHDEVERLVRESGVHEGLALISAYASPPARKLDRGGYRIRSRAQPYSNVLARKVLILLLGYLLP